MIVFLHGPDTFRARQKLKEITVSYEKAHQGQVRSFYFDCKEHSPGEVQAALETISLFERKKLVILEGVFQNSAFVQWIEEEKKALEKSEQHVLVLFERGEIKAKTQNKLYQWLKKHARQQEFLPLSAGKLQLWIVQEFQKYGLQIAPRAQELLARGIGNDLWRLSGEIQKLAAFKQAGQVKEGDVALFVGAAVETDVFATIDAAASKNKKQAFSLLYRHLQKGDPPHYIFSMLQYQFRTLLEIRGAMERSTSRQAIATQVKMHPYVLQKGMRVAERFSLSELKSIYERLFRLDWQIKTGRAEPQASLDNFIATL